MAGGAQTVRETGVQMYYGGLYAMDTFQLNRKLTLNYGIRWEQPGAFKEHHDLNTVFLPNVQDSAVPLTASPSNPTPYATLSAEPNGLLALVSQQQLRFTVRPATQVGPLRAARRFRLSHDEQNSRQGRLRHVLPA